MPLSTLNPSTEEGVELGRYLFYDSILSEDHSMACASCHKQKFAFSDAPNKLSTGNNGQLMKRNTLPLFNLAWYRSYFWDGRAATLEDQIYQPVSAHTEMNLKWPDAERRLQGNKFYRNKFKKAFGETGIDSVLVSKAIAQFLRTLISHTSKFDKVFAKKASLTTEEFQGYILVNDMAKGDCLHCHTTDANVLGTNLEYINNGLDNINSVDQYKDKGLGAITGKSIDCGKFKVPSLRNLLFTAPYMHDGRFKTLEDVVNFYSEGVNKSINIDPRMEFAHQGGVKLSKKEKGEIVLFLKTLTDSEFVSDKAFSNPFLKK